MPLLCEKRGSIAILTLSRPEARNAWCEAYNEGFIDILPKLEADKDIRCVVLTGDPAGNAFSAGADLKNPETHAHASMADFLDEMIVASERAEWRLPQSRLGIMPAQGGTVRVARWVGKGLAMRLAYGFPLPAGEAYRIGLAQWLVPPEGLMDKAMEVANHIADQPPLAVRVTKESLRSGLDSPLSEAVLGDLYRFAVLKMTEDKAKSHQAWRERRKPNFKGRQGRRDC